MFSQRLFLLVLAIVFLLPLVFSDSVFDWAAAQNSSFSAKTDWAKVPFEAFTTELPVPSIGSITTVSGANRYYLPVTINNPFSSESSQFVFVGESQFGIATADKGLCFKFLGCGSRTQCLQNSVLCGGGTCCIDYQACAAQGNVGLSSSVFLGEPSLTPFSCLNQSFVKPVSDSLVSFGDSTCITRSVIDSKGVSGLTKFSVFQNQTVCQTTGDPSGKQSLKQVGLQVNVWVDSANCRLPEGTLVVSEPFKSGALVSKDRLCYPSKAFCSKFPILKTKGLATEQRMDASLLEYDRLLKGETLVVPDGEVWNLFYVIDANPTIDLVCSAGGVWNTEKKVCEKFVTGFVFVCPSGAILDESRGTCSIQGQIFCPDKNGLKGTLSIVNNQSVCLYQPPAIVLQGQVSYDCSKVSGVWDYGLQKCVVQKEDVVCDKGFFSKEKMACVYNPPLNYNCPVGTPTVLGDGNVVCLEQAATIGVCPSPLTFSSVFNACVWKPPLLCNPYLKSVYNPQSLSCEFNSLSLVKCPFGDGAQTYFDFVKQECNYSWLTTNLCPDGYGWRGNGVCSHVPTSEELCPIGWEFNFTLGSCTHAPDFYQLCPTVDYVFEPASSNIVSEGKCVLQAPDVLFKQVISLPDKNIIFSFDYGKLIGTGTVSPDVTVVQLSDATNVVDCRNTPNAWQCSNPQLEDLLSGRVTNIDGLSSETWIRLLQEKQKNNWINYLPYVVIVLAIVVLGYFWLKRQ